MAAETTAIDAVPVSRIFLSLDNPRHIPLDSEPNVIDYLCNKEDVYNLARDIAKHGLNPLERFALVPVSTQASRHGETSYNMAEGNRRLCAIKLLNDSELAPAPMRRAFAALAECWRPIKTVPDVVFKDKDSINLWLERIHSGPQGGIGRKEWNSEQKTRFHGDNKNRAAQALLDYAQTEKMITAVEREGKLTTVQRFLSNDIFREAIGFDLTNPEDVSRTRPKPEFDTLLKQFIRDLVAKKDVHSRMNKEEIIKYARPLAGC